MEIEKGKLYYDTIIENLFIAEENNDRASDSISNKIAVHCPTKQDWNYVVSQGYELCKKHITTNDICFGLHSNRWAQLHVYEGAGYHVITIDQFKEFYPPNEEQDIEVFNPQPHYDNSKGSLYKLATELNLNHWEFDILKRLVRCRKKGQFKQDLQKIKDTIDIYINEY